MRVMLKVRKKFALLLELQLSSRIKGDSRKKAFFFYFFRARSSSFTPVLSPRVQRHETNGRSIFKHQMPYFFRENFFTYIGRR